MKNTVVIAIAGGILMNALNMNKADKQNDVFSKADSKYQKSHEKRCNAKADNCKAKHWRTCKVIA